jgi:hypothetical protein
MHTETPVGKEGRKGGREGRWMNGERDGSRRRGGDKGRGKAGKRGRGKISRARAAKEHGGEVGGSGVTA